MLELASDGPGHVRAGFDLVECCRLPSRLVANAEDAEGPFLKETLEARGSSYNGYPVTQQLSERWNQAIFPFLCSLF